MQRPEALLPPVTNHAEYEALRIDANIWPLVMRMKGDLCPLNWNLHINHF
jgi:hypothetical protein